MLLIYLSIKSKLSASAWVGPCVLNMLRCGTWNKEMSFEIPVLKNVFQTLGTAITRSVHQLPGGSSWLTMFSGSSGKTE